MLKIDQLSTKFWVLGKVFPQLPLGDLHMTNDYPQCSLDTGAYKDL